MLQSQLVTQALAKANFDAPGNRFSHAIFTDSATPLRTRGRSTAAALVAYIRSNLIGSRRS